MNDPLITLTTDFGDGSAYVASMKGVIFSVHPDARIVDISHCVAPQDVRQAARLLADVTPWFPTGTIHVAVVDPGVGTDRKIVFAEIGQQRYLAPDNGLLSRLAMHEPPSRIHAVDNSRYWLAEVSPTFHGRDIMGPVAARLAMGLDPAALGLKLPRIETLDWPEPKISSNIVTGEIVAVDRFGNLISNITMDHLPTVPHASPRIVCGGRTIDGIARTYAMDGTGALVALFGSTGCLEVAVVDGNARAELGVEVGAPLIVRW